MREGRRGGERTEEDRREEERKGEERREERLSLHLVVLKAPGMLLL